MRESETDKNGRPRAVTKQGVHQKVMEIFSAPAWQRGHVLDVGCGQGALALELVSAGYRVSACDRCGDNFLADRGEIEFREADLSKSLPYEDHSFDYVVTTEVLEHLENPFQALHEFGRVIKPEGRLVLTTPNYLNIEMRLRFLLTGSLSTPRLDRENTEALQHEAARGHIMPMTWWVLRLAIEGAGFEIERIDRNQKKRKQIFLWPLVALIQLLGRLRSAGKRRKWLLEETNSPMLIMGGNVLVLVARRAF